MSIFKGIVKKAIHFLKSSVSILGKHFMMSSLYIYSNFELLCLISMGSFSLCHCICLFHVYVILIDVILFMGCIVLQFKSCVVTNILFVNIYFPSCRYFIDEL